LQAARTTGNYRLYDSLMISVIQEIQRLKKELRLTLPEIKERLQKFGTTA
jgi:DNA-binding transcriptional MerR regulator